MTQRIYCDRSRVESYARCPRLRFLNYHECHMGIEGVKKPLPLCVGSSVHVGLEHLLRHGQQMLDAHAGLQLEEDAVQAALTDFATYAGALELDAFERNAMQAMPEKLHEQLSQSLGMTLEEAGLPSVEQRYAAGMSQFDAYLAKEQAQLVEALVRAYCRRRLVPLLEQFTVLEVEREGEWLLSNGDFGQAAGNAKYGENWAGEGSDPFELWFMSRPDALLLEKESQQLYLMSFKTAATWDMRKEKDAQHDMQGLSEGVEVEQRLARWWHQYKVNGDLHEPVSTAMHDFLVSQSAPPRILAIRYEYILKGERWKDKDLSARLGMECRSQRTHLLRQYVCTSVPTRGKSEGAFTYGDVCWSWDYIRTEDMKDSTLAWQNWKSQPVADSMTIKQWIDMLDASTEEWSGEDATVGLEPRLLGWRSQAQRMGVTAKHPLDSIFIPPIVIYRNEDELRDWLEQISYQEAQVAEHVAQVHATTDEAERRSLLNKFFAQNRRSCEYPSTCAFAKGMCWGSDEVRRDPLGSGLYKIRIPNHPIEGQG